MTGAAARRRMAGVLAGLWLALAPGSSLADAVETAMAAAERLKATTEALTEAEGARDRVAALTRTISAYEEGLASLRDGLRRAAIRDAAIRRRFDARSTEMAQLLGVLTALERTKGPSLLLHPSGPLGTARLGMILADVTPALQAEVEAIRADLQEIAMMRALQESAAETLEEGLSRLQQARVTLSQAISERRDLPRRLTDDPDVLRALLEGAETLDNFATGLAGAQLPQAPDNEASEDFAAARGTLPLPVQGSVLRHAGEADAAGIRRPGLVLATRPRALVTAPWPATIRYLGPLIDYANVMVLEPAEDHLLVLAGLDIVYGDVGEVVPEGAALGMMGGEEPRVDQFLAGARQGDGGLTETLYLELRQGTEPVDPAEWFAHARE